MYNKVINEIDILFNVQIEFIICKIFGEEEKWSLQNFLMKVYF